MWRTLESLRARARRDPKTLPQYRALLTKAIQKIKANRADAFDNEQAGVAAREFIEWLDAERRTKNIAEHEGRRIPGDMESWVAKHYKSVWDDYMAAFQIACETPSGTAIVRLKQAAQTVMAAFLDGF